jgi:hypothetical protein
MKTMELYLLVFVTRYLDLFFSFVSYYNTLMKVFFLNFLKKRFSSLLPQDLFYF